METTRQELSKLLSVMMHKFIIAYNRILDSDVSGAQIMMMEILQREGPKRSSELAEALQVTLPAITNLANKLVAKSCIERRIPEHDRRVILLELTPEGEDLLEAVNAKYGRLTESLWKDFSEEELADLHTYYTRMVANLDLQEGTVK
ncbi:MarR family winged helix-turn-helix transcriptional regulator [Paenibacillus thiaminolyticus]|uniref:MarR family transcriptional regulator n=1 Tax=Paenibacillus thiaminolyticus TaxID=49283 RepID=A0A3A3GAC7_PANTH|nr:MarR family transcriptional regulator [Paenibacillus thiaminolyticus]RJG17039.1 MarR family transcriptional regulator [Paenibacillus thiaminolyticus]